jgi:hypothetical protein
MEGMTTLMKDAEAAGMTKTRNDIRPKGRTKTHQHGEAKA